MEIGTKKLTKKVYQDIIANKLAFEIHELYLLIKDKYEDELLDMELREIHPTLATKWTEYFLINEPPRKKLNNYGMVKTVFGDEFRYIGNDEQISIFEINGKKF